MARMVDQLLVGVRYVTDTSSARRAMRSYGMIADGVAIASAATVGFVVATANALDETAKTARSLDLTTEAYSRYAHAADLSGVTTEQLGAGLRALTMQIGGVAQGSAEASKNFAAVGVEVQRADGSFRTAADILPEVADGLNRLDEGQRAALRARLLGESGGRLATLLEGGSEGIRQMTQEADALGLTLDGQTAAAAEAFVDNLTRLKAIVTGAGLQLAKVLLPAALDVSEAIVEMATASDGFIRLGIDRTVRTLAFALELLETPSGKVAAGLVAVTAGVGAVRIAGQLLAPVLGRLGLGLGSMTAAAAPWALVIGGAILILEDFYVTAQGGDSMTRRLADSFGYGEETAKYFADTLDMLTEAGKAFVNLAGGAVSGIGSLVGVFQSLGGIVYDLWAGWSNFNLAIADFFTFGLASYIGETLRPMERLYDLSANFVSLFDPEKAARGFRKLNRYMEGDENVVYGTSPTATMAKTGLLASGIPAVAGLARQDAQRRAAEDAVTSSAFESFGASSLGGGDNNVDVSVSVQAGDVREAARRAGEQTERDIIQAYSFAEGL